MTFLVQSRLLKITNRFIPNSSLRAILRLEWILNIGNFSRIKNIILFSKMKNKIIILITLRKWIWLIR